MGTWSVVQARAWARERLSAAGIESVDADVRELLEWACDASSQWSLPTRLNEEQAEKFLDGTPVMEKAMVDAGIILLKYWLEVTPKEQERRLRDRINDGRKIWKLSPMDIKSFNLWDEYTLARDAMFKATDTAWAPWFVARSEDKKRVRLNIISHLLSQIPYKEIHVDKVDLPKRKIGKVKPTKYPFRYIAERF